jgi:peptidoglycan/LPS O-acetylase OafA/YrhL
MILQRAHEVDGIRGWAALAVLLFHLLSETFGSVLPWTRNLAVFALINGPLAVFVFFVLSGDALSMAFLRERRREVLDSLLVRRYFRLTIPIAMSCALLFALASIGLTWNKPAGERVGSEWLSRFLDFDPSVVSYLRYVLIEVYSPTKIYGAPSVQYNPMLWTMPVELGGSVLVLLFWYLSPSLRRQDWVLACVTAALAAFGSYYALFFAGMLLSRMRSTGVLNRFIADKRWQVAAPVVFLVALFGHGLLGNREGVRHISLLSAIAIVFCAYTSGLLLTFFRTGLSRFLGDVSFPLYLRHLSVIISLTSYWILGSGPFVSANAAIAISAGTASVCLILAFAFRQVERNALRAMDRRLNFLLRRSSGVRATLAEASTEHAASAVTATTRRQADDMSERI